jgi:coenzyme F420-reducing hydrogenase gamma subunit
VDVVLVEGAVSSEEDAEKILKIRKRTRSSFRWATAP